MIDIKNYGEKELELLKKIKKNDISSVWGLTRVLAFMWVLMIGLAISAYCSTNNISVPYGPELFQAAMLAAIGSAAHFLWTIVSLDNQFIQAMADRTGLKVIEKNTLICEGDYPQLYDEKTKTYYLVGIGKNSVRIQEIKNL